MIPGGTLGEHIKEHGKLGINGSLTIVDDGTWVTVSSGGTALFRINKSTGEFQIKGGYTSDAVF